MHRYMFTVAILINTTLLIHPQKLKCRMHKTEERKGEGRKHITRFPKHTFNGRSLKWRKLCGRHVSHVSHASCTVM